MTKLRYMIEALACLILFGVFKILPVQWASNAGGFLGRTIGPKLAASRKADKNLRRALPDLNDHDRQTIIKDMWDNLGRVFAEYPHLETIADKHINIINAELVEKVRDENGAVFFSGHLGNWELWSAMAIRHFDADLNITYRAPNNPYIEKILHNIRNIDGKIKAHPKSRESGRKLLQVVKDGGLLAILIDQKYNEGESIPFFGHLAMTNPVAAQLAQRFERPFIPVSCVRHKGANFTIAFHAPIATHEANGDKRPLDDIMAEANLLLEGWIRNNPAQWIWLHRRWDSAVLKDG